MIEETQKLYNKIYIKAFKELEKYVQYCLRCLHRAGIHPSPKEFALCRFEVDGYDFVDAVVYPVDSLKNPFNPLFFYGFKIEYDFKDLEHFIVLDFYEDYFSLTGRTEI